MPSEPPSGLAPLIVTKLVCCGGLLVFAGTGALSGIGAWLLDGGLIWLVVAIAVLAAGLWLWRRRTSGVEAHPAHVVRIRTDRNTEGM